MAIEELPIFDQRDLQSSLILANEGDTVRKLYSSDTERSVYAVIEATNRIMKDYGFKCTSDIIQQGDSLILVNSRKQRLVITT